MIPHKYIDHSRVLLDYISIYAYSNAIFEKGKNRSGKTITGYHRLLILDIDNDTTNFTIKDCKELFEKNNIASLIVPSRSHLKLKNNIVRDRYRVFLFLNLSIPADIAKQDYKYMMQLIVTDLNMQDLVDYNALSDPSRLYYPTKNLDRKLIKKTLGKELYLEKYLEQVQVHNNEESIIKQTKALNKKIKSTTRTAVKSKKPKCTPYQATINTNAQFIYHKIYMYDTHAIYADINFTDILNKYEGIRFEEENDRGLKVKTNSKNTYQLFDSNILYDFKKDISFNVISYIKKLYSCNNIEALEHLREFIDVDRYKTVSTEWQSAITKSLCISKNYKELQVNLIELLKYERITVYKNKLDHLSINGKIYHISEFNIASYQSKADIIKQFQKNREK